MWRLKSIGIITGPEIGAKLSSTLGRSSVQSGPKRPMRPQIYLGQDIERWFRQICESRHACRGAARELIVVVVKYTKKIN